MRIHYFQHVAFEGLGMIGDWIAEKGFPLSGTHFYKDEQLPDIEDFDVLIVMGGPMGVYDEDKISWLKTEKEYIKKSIESGKVVLGICLGAQLIAAALGARVYANHQKEIGWFEVQKTAAGHEHPLSDFLPARFETFHWHGDTFDLPKGALHLIKTEICQNQAFIYENRVVGLQFHFEVTAASLEEMLTNCADELTQKGTFIQTAAQIRAKSDLIEANNLKMRNLLERLL